MDSIDFLSKKIKILGGGWPAVSAHFEPRFPTQFLLKHHNGLPLRESPIKV